MLRARSHRAHDAFRVGQYSVARILYLKAAEMGIEAAQARPRRVPMPTRAVPRTARHHVAATTALLQCRAQRCERHSRALL